MRGRRGRIVIGYDYRGAGSPPLVFVHGFGAARGEWEAQVAHFSSTHATIAVDLPGHGGSAASPTDMSVERFAVAVAEVLRALDLRAVVVGHSLGARVAVETALEAPAHVAALVLIDCNPATTDIEHVLRPILATPEGYETTMRAFFGSMGAGRGNAQADMALARACAMPHELGTAMMLQGAHWDDTRVEQALGSLALPVLVIQTTHQDQQGRKRPLREGETSSYLDMVRAQLPQARIAVVSGTGHFAHVEAPMKTNALIADFLATLRGAALRR